MDWNRFLTTFATILVAETGDETQLAMPSFASAGRLGLSAFAASSLALVATSRIAALAGEAVSRVIPPAWIRRAAGLLFLGPGAPFPLRSPAAAS